ncbi:MAG: hypothetical protein QXN56_06650 [Candidatus Hadarchaeum sp.]
MKTVVRCRWCEEELKFDPERGYVHQDGSIYKQKTLPGGRTVDDHCALPYFEELSLDELIEYHRRRLPG